MYGTTMQHQSV